MTGKKFAVRRSRRIAAASAAVVLALNSFVSAGVSLSSNSVKWTFDPDTSGGTDLKTLSLAAPVSSAMPAAPSYQLSQTYTKNTASSTAKGSIGYVVNSTTATFTLAPGTGVTQNDPGNANYPGNSLVRVDFDGLFTATTPSFGPYATGYVSIGVGGTVGTGGSAGFTGQVQFLSTSGTALRPTVNFSQAYSAAGPFAQTFTSSAILNPFTIATNTQFRVKGFFEFKASNAVTPSGIAPIDFEVGGAPPTATWYVDGDGKWGDKKNWAAPAGSVIEDLISTQTQPSTTGGGKLKYSGSTLPTIPNGIGQRARFANYVSADRSIALDSDITLGALDLSSAGNLNFTTTRNKITFDTEGGNSASIQARNLNGSKTSTVDVPVVLNDSVDVIADGNHTPGGSGDSKSSVVFKKAISGNGKSVRKLGAGDTSLDAANTYSGGTTVEEGDLNANVTGALGTGNVRAQAGRLNYNAAHAAKVGVPVVAEDGGEINLNIVAQANEKFVVGNLGAISGSAAELEALNNTSDGSSNLKLEPGAMIAHETFDTGSKGGPKNLGSASKYIFGIAADFQDPNKPFIISVGSDSSTPWSGFGSSRGDHVFGSNPSGDKDKIQFKGNADIVSLHDNLRINAKLVSTDNAAVINKTGKGTVEMENLKNEFHGPMNVKQGTLLVNGELRSFGGVNVLGDATVGGRGNIEGSVDIAGGGILSPGSNRAGQAIGTLHTGDLTLAPTSILNFDLGTPDATDSLLNDLVDVQGTLRLDGKLNITDTGSFGPGSYTLFDVSGAITDLGLDIGSVPNSLLSYSVSVLPGSVVLNVTPASSFSSFGPEAIPEPRAAVLIIGAMTLFTLVRRRE